MANVINFNDDQNNNGQQNGGNSQPASTGGGSSISPVSAFNSQQSVQPQQSPNPSASSGQFTNIQKYLQANKGAGQQVAGGVQNQMQKSMQPGQIKEQDAAKQFASSVQSANDVLGRGQGYQQQLQAPVQATRGIADAQAPGGVPPVNAQTTNPQNTQQQQYFDPNAIVSDPNKLQDFTKIRTGLGFDQTNLTNQAAQAQTLAGLNQQNAQDLLGQTQTAQGRAGLVSQAFNRPNYTQGQQRLDNLFLTGAGKQGIGAIQQNAKQNVAGANDIYGQTGQGVQQAGTINQQGQDLSKNLQTSANNLESGYVNNLQSLVPEINSMRGEEKDRWQKNFDILTGKTTGQIDPDIYKELQLRTGEHSFNVLNDPNLTLRQIAQVSDRNALTAQDAASQKDVDYYNSLAKLSKGTLDQQGNFTGPTSDQLLLSGPSDLGRAVQSNTGENSIRGKLDTAQDEFIKKALAQNVVGHGVDTGSGGGLGGGGSNATAQAQMNLAQYLGGNGIGSSSITGGDTAIRGVGDSLHDATQQYTGTGHISTATADALDKYLPGSSSLTDISRVGQAGIDITNGLTGASNGSQNAANYRAQNDLMNQLAGVLKSSGYNNYVSTGGNKNIDDLMNQNRMIDTSRLDTQTNSRYNILGQTPDQIGQNTVGRYLSGNQAQNANDTNAYNSGILKSGYTPQQINDMASTDPQKFQELSQKYAGGGDPRDAVISAQRYADALGQATSAGTQEQSRLQNEYNQSMATRDAQQQNVLNQARQFTGINNLLLPSLNYNMAGRTALPQKNDLSIPEGEES